MKTHKCEACLKRRKEMYMVIDRTVTLKNGKERTIWQCGDCFEENRGRRKPTKKTANR